MSCLDNRLYQQSVDYYAELIPLHQRTRPNRGIGSGTLSTYYESQARAYSALKQTANAVDAASGAIVSWGPTHKNRTRAIETLKQVLREANDRDEFAALLDAEAEKTGQDRPIVRKALGQVLLDVGEFQSAIAQLKLALELQPNDTQTHQALLKCYDKLDDQEGGIRQLMAMAQLSRRDLKIYQQLGERLKSRPQQRERAVTSMVEMLPSESESHTALAEIRQKDDRWDDAILHWQEVARIRALEPTGLLKLSAAQIHQKQFDEARAAIRKLERTVWPTRFNDVEAQIRKLRQQLPDDTGKR